jgi:hypothetical protein
MWAQKETTTTRDVVASEIPAGTKFTIPAGARVQITQSTISELSRAEGSRNRTSRR